MLELLFITIRQSEKMEGHLLTEQAQIRASKEAPRVSQGKTENQDYKPDLFSTEGERSTTSLLPPSLTALDSLSDMASEAIWRLQVPSCAHTNTPWHTPYLIPITVAPTQLPSTPWQLEGRYIQITSLPAPSATVATATSWGPRVVMFHCSWSPGQLQHSDP